LLGERRLVAAATFDLGKYTDAPQQMLIHRVVVVHIELHHGDDPAKCWHEAAETTGFVHPPKHGFRVALRGEEPKEQISGFLVVPQLSIDQVERARDRADRVRMEGQLMVLREKKDPNQIAWITLKNTSLRQPNPVLVENEIVAFHDV